MSKLSKFLRSDGGKLLTSAAVAYAKKQSADVRRAGPVVDVLVEAATQEKPANVLAGTIYGNQTEVNIMAEQPQITPVKSGTQTSSFKAATYASIATMVLPILLKAAENWMGTLPANSWLAFVMPGVIAIGYGINRFLTTNGERQATAQLAAAQAAVELAKAQPVTYVAGISSDPLKLGPLPTEDDYEPAAG